MSYSEKALLHRLKQLGLSEGSGDFRDYETAKKTLQEQGLTPADYQKSIRQISDFLRCEF